MGSLFDDLSLDIDELKSMALDLATDILLPDRCEEENAVEIPRDASYEAPAYVPIPLVSSLAKSFPWIVEDGDGVRTHAATAGYVAASACFVISIALWAVQVCLIRGRVAGGGGGARSSRDSDGNDCSNANGGPVTEEKNGVGRFRKCRGNEAVLVACVVLFFALAALVIVGGVRFDLSAQEVGDAVEGVANMVEDGRGMAASLIQSTWRASLAAAEILAQRTIGCLPFTGDSVDHAVAQVNETVLSPLFGRFALFVNNATQPDLLNESLKAYVAEVRRVALLTPWVIKQIGRASFRVHG